MPVSFFKQLKNGVELSMQKAHLLDFTAKCKNIFPTFTKRNVYLIDFEDDGEDESDGSWQQELQRRYEQEANFMAELRARHPSTPPGSFPQPNQNFVADQSYNHGNEQPNFPNQDANPGNHGHSTVSLNNFGIPNQSSYGAQVCMQKLFFR